MKEERAEMEAFRAQMKEFDDALKQVMKQPAKNLKQ